MELIDCRGLSCPKPVLLTKSALETNPSGNLTVLVDSITARENVMRFVRNNGRVADWKEENGLFTITIASGQEKTGQANLADWRVSCATAQTNDAPVLLLSTDELGTGSSELGRLLLRNFIYTIAQRSALPKAVVLINAGVKLCVENSPVIEELAGMQEKGVRILVCGTCLDYYQLTGKLKAGQVSNMYDIADLLLDAVRILAF